MTHAEAAHELDYPDLAYALSKGGDLLDDEPAGDAMRWTPGPANPPGWPVPRARRCPCGAPECRPKETKA